MDFYSRQHEARRQSRRLVLAFLLAVLAVAFAIDLVLFTLLGAADHERATLRPLEFASTHPGAAFFCTLFVIAVIGISSLFKSLQLRAGGGVVATSLGGVRVDAATQDPKLRRLRNVVEEMAIASGVAVPEIYVLEHESGINAFAAGHTPANAAVTVTQGALDRLNREQLQGVIAHEFSHVVNGDMRLNVQLMGWIFGLFVVALIGRTILRFAPRGGKKNGGAILIVALAFVILGYAGLLAGRILQAAVSRQRERLADASAVQVTRNPGGLKDALLKIAGLADGSKLGAASAEQVAHMLFAPGLKRVFATHPPLIERIRSLDPSFNEKMLPQLAEQAIQSGADIDEFDVAPLAQFVPAAAPLSRPRVAADAEGIAAQVGQLDTLHIERAHELRLAFPQDFQDFATTPASARAMVLALLLSREASVRNRQLTRLANALDPAALEGIKKCAPIVERIVPMLRLPAVLRVFPALRRLSVVDRQLLCSLADDLITADSQIDVFEFCLARLLETLLQDELQARAPHGNFALKDLTPDLELLFAVLAQTGTQDFAKAQAAYLAGAAELEIQLAAYAAPQSWQSNLGAALGRLDKLKPLAKRSVVEGLVKTVAHDATLNVGEAELLRTVCATLHCPLPPLLPGVAAPPPT
jgi:Zn-dependent protease with chaperone function